MNMPLWQLEIIFIVFLCMYPYCNWKLFLWFFLCKYPLGTKFWNHIFVVFYVYNPLKTANYIRLLENLFCLAVKILLIYIFYIYNNIFLGIWVSLVKLKKKIEIFFKKNIYYTINIKYTCALLFLKYEIYHKHIFEIFFLLKLKKDFFFFLIYDIKAQSRFEKNN